MIDITLPDIGEGIAEGEIVQWTVKVGDTVEQDQTLLEVLTDKAAVEIPAPERGVVKELLYAEGDLVPVGKVIARLGQNGASESTAKPPKTAAPQAASEPVASEMPPASKPPPPPSTDWSQILATPSIRKYAREKDINLSQVKGSGPYGRILREDIDGYISLTSSRVSQILQAPAGAQQEERIPLRGIRRKIAQQMVKAKFTAPDFLYADEADLTELVSFRQSIRDEMKARGVKMTYLPFIIKAVIAGLKQFPTLNASLEEETQEIVLKKYYNIGFATASPHGLFVPVIHQADRLSLIELALEIERLAAVVREGKAKPAEMQGGTFTITNIGAIGGMMSAPIINHPEVAIMGVNKIYQKPMVYQGEIVSRWACMLSLSFDHRVVDGADAAHFTNYVMARLEDPRLLLLE